MKLLPTVKIAGGKYVDIDVPAYGSIRGIPLEDMRHVVSSFLCELGTLEHQSIIDEALTREKDNARC